MARGDRRIYPDKELTVGDSHAAVGDLQRRLADAGLLDLDEVVVETFCETTRQAVAQFQKIRALRVSGVCDDTTWSTLVESSFKLGDRLLYLVSPLVRGDDVAQLQLLLSRVGFDCGRVDGFLGPKTAKVLTDFQQNYGLIPDGICGPQTLQALRRASRNSGLGPGVGIVRQRHTAKNYGDDLAKLRVVVGQFGHTIDWSSIWPKDCARDTPMWR
ncbi:MAG: peptidoglycan-binding domain-containing protein [Actinomycetota bacterium]